MELVDMHHEPGEGGAEATAVATPPTNDYPWNLCVRLSEYELEKLGVDPEKLPTAGNRVHLEALAVIKRSATEDWDSDGDIDSVCLELQITHLGLEHEGDEEDEEEGSAAKAHRLYGPKEG